MGVQLEHACNQVLELIGKEAWLVALHVHLPEQVSSVGGDKFVESIGGVSLGERWMLGVQDKQNHTECEQINYVALVWLAIQDFWGHVRGGTDHGVVKAATVSSCELGCKAEIDDLQIVILVKQDVFRLEITMAETVRMKVMKTHQNLFEVCSADFVTKSTCCCNKVEEFTA